MIDKSFIEKIEEMTVPSINNIDGRTYSTKPLELITEPDDPRIDTVKLTGLDGLMSILITEVNYGEREGWDIFINILTETLVKVFSPVVKHGGFRQEYYEAAPILPNIEKKLNTFMRLDEMIIFLSTNFIDTEERNELVKLLSNITDEKSVKMTDDGLSQTVNVKQGIAMQGQAKIKNIVKLKPYRTFLEAEQPEQLFMPRLDGSGTAALFEADGGMWKIQAKKNISTYIRGKIPPNFKGFVHILD